MSIPIHQKIKDQSHSDPRAHVTGVVCDIFDAKQIIGMSSILSVRPVGFKDPNNAAINQRMYNVIPIGSAGVYGFPTALKDAYYAYVLTDDTSKIEGKPAVIIPKTVLLSNPGSDWVTEPNIISIDNIDTITLSKEKLIVNTAWT